MSLDPGARELVSHLYGATIDEVMSGRIVAPEHVVPRRLGVKIEEIELGGVPCRLYRSVEAGASCPALVWAHGGAWVAGNLDMPEAHAVAQQVAFELAGAVISVDYRLAPDAQHPDARDDLITAFQGAVDALAIDDQRVALGGASAGGNLAAAAAIAMRDDDFPKPAALFLAYPATDPIDGPYPTADRPDEVPETLWLTQPLTAMGFGLYTGDPVPDEAVPHRCDLAGLPSTLVTTAGYDALSDQAKRFVELAEAAGVDVTHHGEPTFLHGYLNMVSQLPTADAALTRHTTWLRTALS
jgi:acetyl esterase/lipase